jgi:HSP20 family protein
MPRVSKSAVPVETHEGRRDFQLPEEEGQLTVDVFQTPDEFVIKSTVAGVNAEDLDIDIRDDMVTIRGSRKKDEEVAEDAYLYQECFWGAFSRTVILPEAIDAGRAKAALKNGVLTIRLPKLGRTTQKKVAVTEE